MPTNIQDLTTIDLVECLKGGTDWEFTREEIGAELEDRLIPDTYETVALRGGIRPTHQPLNP